MLSSIHCSHQQKSTHAQVNGPPSFKCALPASWNLSWSHHPSIPHSLAFSLVLVSLPHTIHGDDSHSYCARSSSRLVGFCSFLEKFPQNSVCLLFDRTCITLSAADDWYVRTLAWLNRSTAHSLVLDSPLPVKNLFLNVLFLLSFTLSVLPGARAGDCFNDGCAPTILRPCEFLAHRPPLVLKARPLHM